MAIRKRGNGYQVSLSKNGRRWRKSVPTQSEAELQEAEGRAAILRGEEPWGTDASVPISRPVTLQQLADLTYRQRWAGTKGERTAVTNAAEVVDTLGASTKVRLLDQAAVNLVHRTFRAHHAPATVNRKMAALSAMLTLAVEEGVLEKRPKIPREKTPPGRMRYLLPEEELELLGQVEDDSIRALLVFLVETGCRIGEILTMHRSDYANGRLVLRDTKAGKTRTIPVTTRGDEAYNRVSRSGRAPWAHLTQSQITHAWNQAKSRVPSLDGDPQVVPHCLRHTCASRLVQAGVNLIAVQRWLGHSSLRQTLVYAHLAPDQFDKARNTLQEFNARHFNADSGAHAPDGRPDPAPEGERDDGTSLGEARDYPTSHQVR